MALSRSRLVAAVAAVVLTAGCGASAASQRDAAGSSTSSAPETAGTTPTTTAPPAPTQLELPGGGTQVFPGHRLVGFSGGPGSPALGRLTGDLTAAAEQLRQQ